MARKPGSSPSAIKNRAAKTAAALAPSAQAATAAAKAPAPPKKPINPVRFAQEVRAETRKITWTTRKETWITSVMVFIMVLVASIFFGSLDTVLGFLIRQIFDKLT